jgi:hypothetical protein
MKNYVCLFSVEYINIDNETKTEYGLIYADDFRDAMNQLEGHIYGDDLVKINSMELFDTSAVFTKEVFDLIHKEIEQGI